MILLCIVVNHFQMIRTESIGAIRDPIYLNHQQKNEMNHVNIPYHHKYYIFIYNHYKVKPNVKYVNNRSKLNQTILEQILKRLRDRMCRCVCFGAREISLEEKKNNTQISNTILMEVAQSFNPEIIWFLFFSST